MARVHIMMATYNGERYLKEQLDSILNQTYTDWALYISDDGSTDRTVSIIEQYVSEHPDRIFRLEAGERMGGATENFTFLFSECPKAQYYMFSDQDDVWLDTKIENMVKAMEERPDDKPVLAYCDLAVADRDLRVIADSYFSYQGLDKHKKDKKYVLYKNYIPGCVMMFNDALKSAVVTIPKEASFHDWWLTLVATFFGEVVFTNERGNLYRQHDANGVGAQRSVGAGTDIKRVCRVFFSNPAQRIRVIVDAMENKLLDSTKQSKVFYHRYAKRMSRKDSVYTGKFCRLTSVRGRVGNACFFAKNYRNIGLGPVRYTASILALLHKQTKSWEK